MYGCKWGTPLWCYSTFVHMLKGSMVFMAVLFPSVYLHAQLEHILFQDGSLHHIHHFGESRGIKVMNLGVILNLREVCRVPL